MLDLTFVIPFRNEEEYLERTCESLARQEVGDHSVEVLLIDGMSTDRSREIAEAFSQRMSYGPMRFHVLSNPKLTTAFAFNLGISAAKGRIIGFGGAHSQYPPHFFRRALELSEEIPADVFGGGASRFIPSTRGALGEAMAFLYRSPMGSGVASYHRKKEAGFVDTVYGGFYRREVFEKIGLFDTRLDRNQDNELNARVTAAGLRIYFDPSLSVEYVIKTDFTTFTRRGYRFGEYHPFTWWANPRSFRLRHAVPLSFVVYVIVALTWGIWESPLWAVPGGLYLGLMVLSGLSISLRNSVKVGFLTMLLFPCFHLAYGAGTIVGFVKLVVHRKKRSSLAGTLA